MARRRAHLNHAPIVEAVIDFRIVPREGTLPNAFENARDAVGSAYNEMTRRGRPSPRGIAACG